MKILLLLSLLIFLCAFDPTSVEPIKITIPLILALIVGFYEVIVRLVPTVGQWGLIGKIIDILKWLSDFLNRKKV